MGAATEFQQTGWESQQNRRFCSLGHADPRSCYTAISFYRKVLHGIGSHGHPSIYLRAACWNMTSFATKTGLFSPNCFQWSNAMWLDSWVGVFKARNSLPTQPHSALGLSIGTTGDLQSTFLGAASHRLTCGSWNLDLLIWIYLSWSVSV